MKLGKIERFILRYLYYYQLSTGHPDSREYHGYRSQMVYVLFNLRKGNTAFSYRRNLKQHIPPQEYRSLQVTVSRSTKSLEAKGFIFREHLQDEDYLKKKYPGRRRTEQFRRRRYAFFLTESGITRARELTDGRSLGSVADILHD